MYIPYLFERYFVDLHLIEKILHFICINLLHFRLLITQITECYKLGTNPNECSNLTVTLTTKDYGIEIAWSLGEDCQSDYHYDGYDANYGYEDDQELVKICCLTSGMHPLICSDRAGDGWHGGYLTINNVRYCESWNDDGFEQTTSITIGRSTSFKLFYMIIFCTLKKGLEMNTHYINVFFQIVFPIKVQMET